MATEELNKALRDEINKTFADLSVEIGKNRQQLANKVLSVHMAINKELSRNVIDANREKAIRQEIASVVRMAHQQLPQIKFNLPKTEGAPKPASKPKPVPAPKSEVKPAAKPEVKRKPTPKPTPKAKPAAKKKK
jgi:outer membrane biosynthesis protein TonB